ncbi:glutathione S-transferase T1 [Selaginella moellendorffii]|uniref:glutathione S-transferase T1 n=1 Tax=Selaginella moellendorffii TaxID=88036 RepID=UPI000D1C27D9|nr:glutathione S-transferase T1 [Selaginella moellendorffii]|eukprot:XP_024535662.1 glutathione S-transferase T1 [Selaginella moellendorffii]
MGQVPAIVENGFKLFERYPSDPQQRAQIDSILDWHHGNLRRGATGLFMAEVIFPMNGAPKDTKAIADAEKTLQSALSNIEDIWLDGNTNFLGGSPQPSVADLILSCEIMELESKGNATAPSNKNNHTLQKLDSCGDAHNNS